MKTVLIASNNAHKAVEIAEALHHFPVGSSKPSSKQAFTPTPSDAETFLGNARIKAQAAQQASGGMAVLADDSGLEVDALDGSSPGVHSAR